jgi:hypothetical protein
MHPVIFSSERTRLRVVTRLGLNTVQRSVSLMWRHVVLEHQYCEDRMLARIQSWGT